MYKYTNVYPHRTRANVTHFMIEYLIFDQNTWIFISLTVPTLDFLPMQLANPIAMATTATAPSSGTRRESFLRTNIHCILSDILLPFCSICHTYFIFSIFSPNTCAHEVMSHCHISMIRWQKLNKCRRVVIEWNDTRRYAPRHAFCNVTYVITVVLSAKFRGSSFGPREWKSGNRVNLLFRWY